MLAFIIVLLLALVWIIKKYKRVVANKAQYNVDHQQPMKSEQREAVLQQNADDGAIMEMKSNGAYISTVGAQQIPTEDNVAYGQIERDHNLLGDQCDEREMV